jgi:hypothetical protein
LFTAYIQYAIVCVPEVIASNAYPYVDCPNALPSVAIQMMLIPNAAPKTVYLPELWQAHDEPCLALIPNAHEDHPKCYAKNGLLA